MQLWGELVMDSPGNDVLLITVVLLAAVLFCVVVAATVYVVALGWRARQALRKLNRNLGDDE